MDNRNTVDTVGGVAPLVVLQAIKKARRIQIIFGKVLIAFVIVLCLILLVAGGAVLGESEPPNNTKHGVPLLFSGLAIGFGFGMAFAYHKLSCGSFKTLETALDMGLMAVPG